MMISIPRNQHVFSVGNYQQALEEQQRAQQITSVLYPKDDMLQGKELRLKQQYFFVAATIADILGRFRRLALPWDQLPNHVKIASL